MTLNLHDLSVLAAIARYYVLTRQQVQSICFPDHQSGRATRKRLTRLHHAGYIKKHVMQMSLPGSNAAAPVYYPTKAGCEALAGYFDDESWLASNTRHPRADRIAHWIEINAVRLIVEAAVNQCEEVELCRWITEWEVINKEDAKEQQFVLHTQLSNEPKLSCSPDAAILLSAKGHKKVFYLEVDRGTSTPQQNAHRKHKGYAELARRRQHRVHFPETTLDDFSVLMITVSRYHCRKMVKELEQCECPELWLLQDASELNADSFLTGPITWDHKGEKGPLVIL